MLFDAAPTTGGFATNVNVLVLPKGPLKDLEQMMRVNRRQLAQMKLQAEIGAARRDDFDVMVGEYSGKVGQSPELHFLMLGYLRGDQQAIVTLTTTAELWQQQEAALRKLMAGIRIEAQ